MSREQEKRAIIIKILKALLVQPYRTIWALRQDLHLNRITLQRYIKELKDKKLIDIEKGKRNATICNLNYKGLVYLILYGGLYGKCVCMRAALKYYEEHRKAIARPHPFLKAHHIEDGDLVAVTAPAYVLKGKYGERTVVDVLVKRSGERYRWSLNGTTSDRCREAWSSDGALWENKVLKVQKVGDNVSGVPYREPQQPLV